jgi:PBSX family phage terminase large subunit
MRANEYNLSPQIPEPFHSIWKSNEENGFTGYGTYVADSGRISGKTQTIGEYGFFRLMSIKHANIVVTRAEDNDIRLTVFSFYQKLISKYRLDRFFKVKRSPFEITFLPNGNKIFFLATNGDISRTKGFELTRDEDYIDFVWFEEGNENDGPEFIDAAMLTFLRFFKPCTKVFYVYNPPESRLHWANSFFPDMYRSGKAVRLYSTWEDIRELLNPAVIQKIEEDKARDYDYYRYWYLGHIISLKGLVFKQFRRDKNTIKRLDKLAIVNMISWLIVAVDGAIKNDATCAGLLAVLRDGRILVLDSYYYDPVKENAQLPDTEQSRRIGKWFTRTMTKFPGLGIKPIVGTVDNANFNLMTTLQGTIEMGYFKWFPATDKKVLRDTHRLQNLFFEDLLIISEDPTTDNQCGIDEIESYVYDEKTQDIKKDQQDHFIDMLKYGTFIYANPYAFNIQIERRNLYGNYG